MTTVNRRALLGRGAMIGAAAALGSPVAAMAAPSRARSTPGAAPPWALFRSPEWNGETLFALGSSSYGGAEIGEVMELVRAVKARTGDPESPGRADFTALVRAWESLAARLERQARNALAAGHRVTARDRFLRASTYYAQALFFVLGTSRPRREEDVWKACERNWLESIALWDPPPVILTITAGEFEMPAYLFRPDASGTPRPTLILCNGSDGTNPEVVQSGLVAGLDRGYNVLLFEGPGQMTLLYERRQTFVPDWAPILGAVVETLQARGDVDSSRIVAAGISFLGMILSSAGARTPGLRAIVLEPGAHSDPDLWGDQESISLVRKAQGAPAAERAGIRRGVNAGIRQAWSHLSAVDRWTIHKRGEIYTDSMLADARAARPPSDYFGFLEKLLEFTYADDLRAIRIPTLVCSNQNDQFFGPQSKKTFDLLTSLPSEAKRLLPLTISIGAMLHDQPIGTRVAQELIFDWLDRVLGA